MAISDSDYKILWGRAGGICSNPNCREDLTILLADKRGYNVGEMAHIIARSADGPRGIASGGNDTYANLVLLCPTCHRKADKAPEGEYTTELLHSWKSAHEDAIRSRGMHLKFTTTQDLKQFVSRKLTENKAIWQELGPSSPTAQADPGSNLYQTWALRKLDRIVPNNREIINVVEANSALLDQGDYKAFISFKVHADAFEANQYGRLDSYPTFPSTFSDRFA